MSDLENLRGIKYYEVRWYNCTQRGHIGNSYFATMKEAEEYIAQETLKNPSYIYRTKEKSILDLIEDERNEAHDEALFEARIYWSKKYRLDMEAEKKKLKEEMQYILRKWFGIDKED